MDLFKDSIQVRLELFIRRDQHRQSILLDHPSSPIAKDPTDLATELPLTPGRGD